MSDSKKTPPPPRTKSGEHPAVRSYRATIDRAEKETQSAFDELDEVLRKYLEETHREPAPSIP
jgi:hypothetical protein